MTSLKNFFPLRKFWHSIKDFCGSPAGFIFNVLNFNRTTDYARWSLNDNLHASWDKRTLMMADYIPSGAAVVEFGAGAQVLRRALPEGCSYQPFDLVARTPDTLVCDLNSGYPDLVGEAEVAVFSGVIEYIQDLPALFRWLRSQFGCVVFSYATYEHTPSILNRRKNGWVNDFTEYQIMQFAESNCFRCCAATRWRGHVIFVLTKT